MCQQVYMEWNSPWCLRDSAPPLLCPLTAGELCGGTCLGFKSTWPEVLSLHRGVPPPFLPLAGAHLPELPWGCGHVGGGALHAHPDGKGGGGHAVTHLGPWRRALHVDQAQQPLPYPCAVERGLGVTCPLAQDSWAARGHTVQRMLSIFQKLQPGSEGHVARVGAGWAQGWL